MIESLWAVFFFFKAKVTIYKDPNKFFLAIKLPIAIKNNCIYLWEFMCDKVSHNLLFQQNEIDLMLSRICTVKTELIQSCICMNMHVPWTSVLVTLFQVQSMNIFGTNVFILFVCLIASLELKYIKLLNDHALCTNFLVFYDRGNCRFFFKLLIFFFKKNFRLNCMLGLFAIKEDRSIYCSNATYVLLSQLSQYSIPLSDLSHVT